jgi:prepilin-type N-terminal cleavage/methylation domain-containing protein
MTSAPSPRRLAGAAGFTLVEVMLALAILGMALMMLMRSAAGSLFATSQAQMLGVVTDLARGKMYDLEEQLAKDGFQDGEQTSQGDFEAQGFATVEWEAKIEEVELPNFEAMQEVSKEAAADGGKGLAKKAGIKPPGGDSFGGSGAGSDEKGATATSGFIEQFYGLISQILKVAVRKVTLTMKWQVLGHPRDFKVVAYSTDPAAMEKAVGDLTGALGAATGGGGGAGAGGGSGSGSGSGGGGKGSGN